MAPAIKVKKRSAQAPKGKPAAENNPAEVDDKTEAADLEETEEVGDSPVFLSKPQPTTGAGKSASSKATSIAAVIALIATLLFLFVILLQWTEWQELRQLFPQTTGFVTSLALMPW